MRTFEFAEVAMRQHGAIRLTALKVHEVGLRTYRNELIVVKFDFLLWEWNWVCATMVQKWDDGSAPEVDEH